MHHRREAGIVDASVEAPSAEGAYRRAFQTSRRTAMTVTPKKRNLAAGHCEYSQAAVTAAVATVDGRGSLRPIGVRCCQRAGRGRSQARATVAGGRDAAGRLGDGGAISGGQVDDHRPWTRPVAWRGVVDLVEQRSELPVLGGLQAYVDGQRAFMLVLAAFVVPLLDSAFSRVWPGGRPAAAAVGD